MPSKSFRGAPPAVLAALLCAAPAAAQPVDEASPVAEPEPDADFGFGTYGRVGVGTDLRGSTPEGVNVVQHGSRIGEDNYVELDLYYESRPNTAVDIRTVATLAFAGDLFHYTGDFDTQLALRNLYALATIQELYFVWVGSRMYRGDDIYLLDFWPLDDANTVGGGVGFRDGRLALEAHAGANRLTDDFQFQMVDVSDPEFGSQEIVGLDRQRLIASAKASYRFYGDGIGPSAKAKVYVETNVLPDGQLQRQDNTTQVLPSDFGWTAGTQLGAWGFGPRNTHANLFLRFSQGLTAHDELAAPFGFDPERRTFPSSSELLLGWSGNYETPFGGALVGGYTRRFMDADDNDGLDDGWEYIADVRPYAAITDTVQAALDLSYQQRFPRGLSPNSVMPVEPAVFQVAPMAVYSPFGLGSYARPQFRLIYKAAYVNDDARDLYPLGDERRAYPWVHFLGVQVEWWFNSTYR